MVAPALIAIVVHASAMSRVTMTRRSPVAVLSRSETSTAGGPRLRLLVRIDAPAAITSIRIADLIENVREIWRPYAEIDFAEIGAAAAGIHDDELRLAITDRILPPGSATEPVLGSIEFLDGRPQHTIAVSVAAAQTMMNSGKWLGRAFDTLPPPLRRRFMTRALSRSAAHEIGHYLLQSRAHAARGLMRERMTVAEIMDDTPALYRLLPSEVAALDQRLAEALAEAPVAEPRLAIVPMRDRKS
jgi:hypothetical protein